jgi:transcription elongation factor Elf1
MHCPACNSAVSVVKFSRDVVTHVMRWHVCKACDRSFETHEVHAVPTQPNSVQPYSTLDDTVVAELEAIINADEQEE